MKWTCEKCKALNAALAFNCHNCGCPRPEDNGPHYIDPRVHLDADAPRPVPGSGPYGRLMVSSLDLKFIRETTPPIIESYDYPMYAETDFEEEKESVFKRILNWLCRRNE
jgi:hypothetical protein